MVHVVKQVYDIRVVITKIKIIHIDKDCGLWYPSYYWKLTAVESEKGHLSFKGKYEAITSVNKIDYDSAVRSITDGAKEFILA